MKTSLIAFALVLASPMAHAADSQQAECVALKTVDVYVLEQCHERADSGPSALLALNKLLAAVNTGSEVRIEELERGIFQCVKIQKPVAVSAPAFRSYATGACVAVTITKQ